MAGFPFPPKPWWRSRTVWLGLLEFAAGVLDLAAESDLTPDASRGALLAAAGVLTILFRLLANRPVDPPRLFPKPARNGRPTPEE